MNKPTARIVVLTPELARDLLSRNTHNRDVSAKNLAKLKRALEHGEWRFNGEAIKVAKDGTLLDGQHRCLAVSETGISIEILLIEGLENSVQTTMDQGIIRTLVTYLKLRGEKQNTRLAAAVKAVYVMRTTSLERAVNNTNQPSTTVAEELEFFDQNQWIRDILSRLVAVQRAAGFPGLRVLTPLYIAFTEIDEDDAADFWDKVEKGTGLHEWHPVYQLRKKLRQIHEDAIGERSGKYIAALTIKAWNAYRSGDDVRQLKWRAGGANPETFPVPR